MLIHLLKNYLKVQKFFYFMSNSIVQLDTVINENNTYLRLFIQHYTAVLSLNFSVVI